MKKVLVIVDFQYDFISGTLPVPGAEKALIGILHELHSEKYDEVILTVDWHKISDKSFSRNGGHWSDHCIECSEGAAIHKSILNTLRSQEIPYRIFYKGTNPEVEEYGAFGEKCSTENMYQNASHGSQIVLFPEDQYYICGLAGDYCVFETWKKMISYGLRVKILDNCIGWIGEPFEYHV